MQELTQLILHGWTWQARVAVGHFLPLLVTLIALWQLRKNITSPWFIAWMFGVCACARLFLEVSKLHFVNVAGLRIPAAISMPIQYAVWFAVLAAMCIAAGGRKVDYRALWAGVFLPLYMVDIYGSLTFFPTSALYKGIGGAGPMDALILAPALAVVMCKIAEWEIRRWPQWCAKGAALMTKAKAKLLPA